MQQVSSAIKRGELSVIKFENFNEFSNTSFNNDDMYDFQRNELRELMIDLDYFLLPKQDIHPDFLYKNEGFQDRSDELRRFGNKIFIGQYYNHGVVISDPLYVHFDKFYNCPPLISKIKGVKDYFSFLHVFSSKTEPSVVDRQVKEWMNKMTNLGDVVETVFAPRKNCAGRVDTKYDDAVDEILKCSKKVILLKRNINQLEGVVNKEGVYFDDCGYHLWSD